MTNQKQETTRADVYAQLTEENLRKPFEEFPKMLYHPDGRTLIVNSRKEQDARGEEFFEKPQEAIDERERRDREASEKFISKVNEEAAEATGAAPRRGRGKAA